MEGSKCTRFVCHNSKTNTDYVYDSMTIIDPSTGKKKVKRKLVGKLDDNGNLIHTGHVGRPRTNTNPAIFGSLMSKEHDMSDMSDTKDTHEQPGEEKNHSILSALNEIEHNLEKLQSQIKQLISSVS